MHFLWFSGRRDHHTGIAELEFAARSEARLGIEEPGPISQYERMQQLHEKYAEQGLAVPTSLATKPKRAGRIVWNFDKFVIDRNGFVVTRFGAGTKPDAPEVVEVIETALAQRVGADEAGVKK